MPPRARVSPGRLAYLHGIGPAQRCGTNRILRIESKQVSYLILREVAAVDGIGGPIGKVGERGASRDRLPRLLGASGGMADALASGASVLRDVGVQVPLRPQNRAEASHRSRVTRLDCAGPRDPVELPSGHRAAMRRIWSRAR